MGISITTIGNKICREFHDEIDIYPSVINRSGVFLAHVPMQWVNDIAMDLYSKHVLPVAFRMIIGSVGPKYRSVTFLPQADVAKDRIVDLLDYMTTRKIPIKWKEGRHGYEIDKEGKILRKWDLRPVKVIASTL